MDPNTSLRWRHDDHDSVSNHQPHHRLLNRLCGCRSKKTSKLRVTGLCVGNSQGTGEFPAQKVSKAENISIWWRHHAHTLSHGPLVTVIWEGTTAVYRILVLETHKMISWILLMTIQRFQIDKMMIDSNVLNQVMHAYRCALCCELHRSYFKISWNLFQHGWVITSHFYLAVITNPFLYYLVNEGLINKACLICPREERRWRYVLCTISSSIDKGKNSQRHIHTSRIAYLNCCFV